MFRSKPCKHKNCNCPVWAKGYCKSHQYLRTDKKPTKLKHETEKRGKENLEYLRKRKEFLSLPENEFCAVFPWLRATEIHHKKGRIGKLLTDERYFLAVSRKGHRKIENNPEWAYEQGFSIRRTNDKSSHRD